MGFCMGLPQSMLMKASAAKDHISCMYRLEQFKNLLNKPKRGVPLNPDLKRVLKKANWKNKTEERAGPYSCPYLLDIPKRFGDVFESMFGAVWLDCNQCLPEIWDIYKSKIIPIMGIDGNKPYNPEFINKLNPRREIGKRLYRLEPTTSSKPVKLNTKDKIREFLKKNKLEQFTEDSLRFTGYFFCFAEISSQTNKDVKKRDFGIGPSENSATFAAYHRLLFQLDL